MNALETKAERFGLLTAAAIVFLGCEKWQLIAISTAKIFENENRRRGSWVCGKVAHQGELISSSVSASFPSAVDNCMNNMLFRYSSIAHGAAYPQPALEVGSLERHLDWMFWPNPFKSPFPLGGPAYSSAQQESVSERAHAVAVVQL